MFKLIPFLFIILISGCASKEIEKASFQQEESLREEIILDDVKVEKLEFELEEEGVENSVFVLTPVALDGLIKSMSPSLKKIESAFLEKDLYHKKISQNYSLNLEGNSEISETDEDFFYSISPMKTASIGIVKALPIGMKVGLYNDWQSLSSSGFGSYESNNVNVRFEMDLFKNLFGKRSLSELKNSRFERDIAVHQKKISVQSFRVAVQKMYWTLVATEEKSELLKDLIIILEKQLEETERKYKNSIADLGDVARQRTALSARKSELLKLEYNKENIIYELKELFPVLADKKVVLGVSEVVSQGDKTEKIVQEILSQKEPFMQWTLYDEVSKLLKEAKRNKLYVDQNYSDPDVSFYAKYGRIDDGDGFSGVDESQKEDYTVGIKFSMALSKERKDVERVQKQINNLSYEIREDEVLSKLSIYHTETKKKIKLLKEMLEEQKKSLANLKDIVSSTKGKYNQARAELRDLIADQEIYIRTSLDGVDLELMLINQIFDYQSVFTEIEGK